MPVGNTWAVNPLPDDTQPGSLGPNGKRLTTLTEFTPPCRNNTDPHPPPHKKIEGLCSGERPFHVSVVDILRVPANTPPGDCEFTANIVHPFCIHRSVAMCGQTYLDGDGMRRRLRKYGHRVVIFRSCLLRVYTVEFTVQRVFSSKLSIKSAVAQLLLPVYTCMKVGSQANQLCG